MQRDVQLVTQRQQLLQHSVDSLSNIDQTRL
jgi:hypothetical protein